MRTFIAALVLTAVACFWSPASAADVGFSDVICPEGTQYVLAVGKLRKDDPPQRIYDAAQAAADAYQRCSRDKLSNGFREAQHYADTRGAGFSVVAARALVALNRPDDARRELLVWRPMVQQVVDWVSETETPAQGHSPRDGDGAAESGANARQGDHRKSMYRAAAKEIVIAIDVELGKLADLHATPKP